ncbi:MAG TPA: hypothetical protein EYP19_14965 [Desulfobacterales bacterium]|nr:hypothetical protein [Desulfobacterales bacterium]
MEKRLGEQYFLERLKYYTELLRLVWVSILAVGGGAIGFIITTITPLKILLASLGFAAVALLVISLIVLNRRIWQTLNEIKEIKDERS